eukprot:CAMPEP_0115145912 /NCGR_PEP_ID=MMETSP0227-20121206/62399_1 /TAXON_ID=89957 /ORGANISM="Polarella glacialis, Strain CCMP 1383" /LENGTH=1121 /DNA_ID=CAMNT_0002555523 /DNA_START=1 /DNA_END=3366 /DNA_ORIENTATION=-
MTTSPAGAQPRSLTFQTEDLVICDNKVITSHYTLLNFIPKNLLEQFSKPANCYFLFLSILQLLPKVTTTGGVPTILLPVTFIVLLNALKDALEDWRRHKSDREENDRFTLKVQGQASSASCIEAKWQDLRVGCMVVVRQNEYVPADIMILSSAHEEGHVFIETANLDGETNLKTKQAPKAAFELVNEHDSMEAAAKKATAIPWVAECEQPNEFLYTFAGNMTGNGQKKIPLDEQHLVLRGCKIKNVAWTLGVVVYTGKETKIMMNSKEKKGRKMSHLERDVGKLTLLIFCIQLVLCLIAAIVSAVFETTDSNLAKKYLNLTDQAGNAQNAGLVLVIRFFNFIILFSNFIPISLLVSMSLVKLAQVFFFYADNDMIYMGIHCMPRTSDLNEELGQIEYVFSDKTGTLTCNIMDFRKFCVNGVTYGQGMTEIKRQVMLKMGKTVDEPPLPLPGARMTPHVDLVDPGVEDLLRTKTGKQYWDTREFLLAVNHEVVPEFHDDKSMGYSASSPDESALCYGARHFGFSFKGRDSSGVNVELEDGSNIKVHILATIKFNSARKRSSVVAKFQDRDPNGGTRERLVLYTKGADSMIVARLAPQHQNSSETRQTMEILKEFAEDGLRTLCLASRDLTKAELDAWMLKWHEASLATDCRQEKMDAVAEELEVNLTMNGISGIEDRLQDEVSDTIIKMTQAGIKVWMLTGDKTETAINIGVATGLLEAEVGTKGERPVFSTEIFEVNGEFQSADAVKKLKQVADQARIARKQGIMFEGMVMDGRCLELALEPENEEDFVAICRNCRTVVCCRVSPKQKGAVVRLIKTKEKAITLAIGDGANDCNMIQSADVGIGIRGLEGLQAFNVCDYGISQFRFLQFILLVHGRWCYRRVAILVNYMFYKNVVVVLPQYFLGCVSGFSGQKLYNDILYQSYNVVHSAAPIMIFALLDQDVSKKASLTYPELYSAGPSRLYMNFKVSLGWLASGLWHALVVFFIPYFTMSNGNMTHSDGKANDIWMVGTVVFLLVCLVVNITVVLETCYLSWLTGVGLFLSFLAWSSQQGYVSGVHGVVVTSELYGSTGRLLGCPMLYLTVLTSLALALMVDIHIKGIRCSFFPTILHEVQAKVLSEKKG